MFKGAPLEFDKSRHLGGPMGWGGQKGERFLMFSWYCIPKPLMVCITFLWDLFVQKIDKRVLLFKTVLHRSRSLGCQVSHSVGSLVDLICKSSNSVFGSVTVGSLPESTYVEPTLSRGDPIPSLCVWPKCVYCVTQTQMCLLCNIYDHLWFYLCVCLLVTVCLTHILSLSLSHGSLSRAQIRFLWLTWCCQHLDLCLMHSNCSVNIWEWMNSRNMVWEKLLGKGVKKRQLIKNIPCGRRWYLRLASLLYQSF